jgi:peroxiredoxin
LREAPAKAALYEEFKDKGLAVVGVDLGEDPPAVRRFARHFGIMFPLLLDRDGACARLFGLWGHPNTVLIDWGGRVVGLVRGERDWTSSAAHALVRALLDLR